VVEIETELGKLLKCNAMPRENVVTVMVRNESGKKYFKITMGRKEQISRIIEYVF
jgi:3-dehydroquinate dehydratase